MKPKYQIFVSSTFTDLREERRVLMEQILNLGHIPVGMELFQAANRKQWDYITKRIVECDYLILIVAERYGSLEKESGKSYTQKEYEFAIENGIPTAAFLLEDVARTTRRADFVEHHRKREIDDLRDLCSTKMVKYWSDAATLALAATNALSELFESAPRPGLIRADTALMERLGMDPSLPESKRVSEVLSGELRRDLKSIGYFRENQCLHFEVKKSAGGLLVKLRFTASIILLGSEAQVYCPIVEPPPNAKMTSPLSYKVNGLSVPHRRTIHKNSSDELIVCYELQDQAIEKFGDDHFWPSPVLNYVVQFEHSDLFDLEVGKITTGSETDGLEPDRLDGGTYVEFKSKSAAFTAQGIRWKLKRQQTTDEKNNV